MPDSFNQPWMRSGSPQDPSRAQQNISQTQSDQWLRKFDLTISGGTGQESGNTLHLTPFSANGIDLPDIRITFQVRNKTTASPDLFVARIYNLSPQTMARAIAFKHVSVSAGYQTGRFGVIFEGSIAAIRLGKENAVDTYLEIIAGDGDSTGWSVSNTSYTKGSTAQKIAEDQVDRIVQQAGNQPLSKGIVDLGPAGNLKILRQMVAVGMNRSILRDICNACGADYWINKGKVNVLSQRKYMPGETISLSTQTGLIGIPEVTSDGIQIRCLLNPNLVLGGLVQVKTSLLSGVAFMPGSKATVDAAGNITGPQPTISQFGQQAQITGQDQPISYPSPTGTYKILLLEHSGDTRGNPWYSDMVCVAIDAQPFENVLLRSRAFDQKSVEGKLTPGTTLQSLGSG